jgi:hypothetical protein
VVATAEVSIEADSLAAAAAIGAVGETAAAATVDVGATAGEGTRSGINRQAKVAESARIRLRVSSDDKSSAWITSS